MASVETPADVRPRRTGRFALWGMLAGLVLAIVVAAVAMAGWDQAIKRADQKSSQAWALQAKIDQLPGLQQQNAGLQRDLADAQRHEQVLKQQVAEAQAALAEAQAKAGDAAAAAEQRAAAAQSALAEAQNRVDALERTDRTTNPQSAESTPAQASNISAATARSDTAPVLPLPGLPPGATARDYLVAAQQATRAGETGKAQAALERAETRLLNQASLSSRLVRTGRHPGIEEIERVLDQLGARDTTGALETIDNLLTQH